MPLRSFVAAVVVVLVGAVVVDAAAGHLVESIVVQDHSSIEFIRVRACFLWVALMIVHL